MSKTTIPTGGITADAINGTLIADDAIDSEHYTDGSIDTAHIGDSQVTSAKTSGVGGVNTPLFHASLGSNQNIADQTYTKLAMSREVLDSNTKYDSGTNYRFTPGETGYYVFQVTVSLETAIGGSDTCYLLVYKNGSSIAINPTFRGESNGTNLTVSFIDQATSTSDYYEAYMWHNVGSNVDLYESGSSSLTYWTGHKLISQRSYGKSNK